VIVDSWTSDRAIAAQNPFTLGVASGDPLPDSVVLWTRLAVDPLNGGGIPRQQIPVEWQIATDENLRQVVQRGTAIARPELAHSVHVDVRELEPARWYWYQFKVGSMVSPIGRTRTAPQMGDRLEKFRFAFASCQNYEAGYFTAYRDLVQSDLDLVVHLGDYLYEGATRTDKPRRHNSPEIVTLADYRNRHALYKTDPDLQAAHAAYPWIFTWDDHEVDNNYANLIPEDQQPPIAFRRRRINAYQAYYEHLPMRRSPQGIDLLLYRRLRFGDLVEFNVLDTRQYRSDQPCGDRLKPRCAGASAPNATLMGKTQEQWLLNGLTRSQTRWNVIAQQVMMGQFDVDPKAAKIYNMDQWDGYTAERNRLLQALYQNKTTNPVVITGDVHSSWVHDLKLDFDRPNSPIVGTEFITTSISAEFSKEGIDIAKAALPGNPHTQFFDGAFRGYVRCELTPQQWQTDYRVVADVSKPDSSFSTLASFVVENGRPGAQKN
jgi:alkaline phosphatase D